MSPSHLRSSLLPWYNSIAIHLDTSEMTRSQVVSVTSVAGRGIMFPRSKINIPIRSRIDLPKEPVSCKTRTKTWCSSSSPYNELLKYLPPGSCVVFRLRLDFVVHSSRWVMKLFNVIVVWTLQIIDPRDVWQEQKWSAPTSQFKFNRLQVLAITITAKHSVAAADSSAVNDWLLIRFWRSH
jgi:hypothetical protein